MSELKTLKDLIVLCDICKKCPEINCRHPCCRNHKRIKQEAIKWIKFLDTPLGLDWDAFDLRNFWLNRFNITEEDLK